MEDTNKIEDNSKPFFDNEVLFWIYTAVVLGTGTLLIEKNIIKKGQVGYFMLFELFLILVGGFCISKR